MTFETMIKTIRKHSLIIQFLILHSFMPNSIRIKYIRNQSILTPKRAVATSSGYSVGQLAIVNCRLGLLLLSKTATALIYRSARHPSPFWLIFIPGGGFQVSRDS